MNILNRAPRHDSLFDLPITSKGLEGASILRINKKQIPTACCYKIKHHNHEKNYKYDIACSNVCNIRHQLCTKAHAATTTTACATITKPLKNKAFNCINVKGFII